MPDNKKKAKPLDPKRINVNEIYEIEYWTKALGVSKPKLIEVVQLVGVSADAVKKALGM